MIIDLYIFIITILQRVFPELFKPAAVVSGVAKDEAGTPLSGVSLKMINVDTAEEVYAVSAEDGSFAFQAVKAGKYELSGYKDNGDGTHYSASITFDVGTANVAVDLILVKILAKKLVR